MKIKLYYLIVFFCFSIGFCSSLYSLTTKEEKSRMYHTLDTIHYNFQTLYAPTEWKQQNVKKDFTKNLKKAKDEIKKKKKISVKQFQYIVKKYFSSLHDHHVGITFFSTESAFLPFRIQKTKENQYILSWVDSAISQDTDIKINKGDELLLFDGQPIDEVIKNIKIDELGGRDDATTHRYAEYYLTNRYGYLGFKIPNSSKKVEITVKDYQTEEIKTKTLQWKYKKEKIPERIHQTPYQPRWKNKKQKNLNAFSPKNHRDREIEDEDKELLGYFRSRLPILGTRIQKDLTTSSFDAYLSLTDNNIKVGFIRIPHFDGNRLDVKKFQKTIAYFQNYADVLVIDELDNPGGHFIYTYALASMLTNKPLTTPKHSIKITQEDVAMAARKIKKLKRVKNDADAKNLLGETYGGYPVNYQLAQNLLQDAKSILEEWQANRTRTNPLPILGIDPIMPHPDTRFTKPIILLTNELSISCAEFFSAILQDNQIAIVIGTHTAGAGGVVATHSFPNLYGIDSFSYTITFAKRANGLPIEDLGVDPHFHYKITSEDLRNHYHDFKNVIITHIKNLVPNPKKPVNPRKNPWSIL